MEIKVKIVEEDDLDVSSFIERGPSAWSHMFKENGTVPAQFALVAIAENVLELRLAFELLMFYEEEMECATGLVVLMGELVCGATSMHTEYVDYDFFDDHDDLVKVQRCVQEAYDKLLSYFEDWPLLNCEVEDLHEDSW